MPPKKDSGIEITSAQGQDTTNRVSARWIHTVKDCFNISGGRNARIRAPATTAGV